MTRYILKTDDRQGEYLKPEYDHKPAPDGWNHYMHPKRKKVEEWAKQMGVTGRIEKVII